MRLTRLPIRARLVAGFAAAMIVVLTAAGAFVFWRVQYALDHRLEQDLRSQTADLRNAASRRSASAALSVLGAQARDAQLLDSRGHVLATGSGLPPATRLLSRQQARVAAGHRIRTGRGNLFSPRGAHLRILASPVRPAGPDGAVVAVTAVRLDQRDEALRELLLQLALANLAALGLACVVGYRLARGALNPVERYRAQAERIAQGATGVRLEIPAGPVDEVSRLGATLNAMLGAQERAAERQQQFVDDASHELRTPLAALGAEVELALNRPRTADELRDALRRISTDIARLAELTDELLTLGAMNDTVAAIDAVEVRPLLEEAADRARRQLDDASPRTVRVDAPTDLMTTGDQALLRRALGNLADNAVRHGSGTITILATALEEHPLPSCLLLVHDEGPGMPPEFLEQAAERFRRAEHARTGPGTGLGLALVDAIATAHRGQLRVCSGTAHHHHPSADTHLSETPCRHRPPGVTVSLLLPRPSPAAG